ncbi:type II secretion system F family protein [Tessaracoccus sp. Z1128]
MMSTLVLAALAAALASWLVLASPSERLASLSAPLGVPVRLAAARPGAPSARQRAAVGAGVLLVSLLILDVGPGLSAGALLGGLTFWGLGFAAPRPDWAVAADELPDALDFLSVCLRVGLPTSRAVADVAGVSPPTTRRLLERVGAELALGRAGPDAWQPLRGHPVWGRPAMDIMRAERSGTSLVGILTDHAEDARQGMRDRAAKRARTVGVRSVVPLMACFLPAFMAVGVVPIIASLMQGFFG